METRTYKELFQALNDVLDRGWLGINEKEQLRAIFTTLCMVYELQADTAQCDDIIDILYDIAVCDLSYRDFYNYMVELIV